MRSSLCDGEQTRALDFSAPGSASSIDSTFSRTTRFGSVLASTSNTALNVLTLLVSLLICRSVVGRCSSASVLVGVGWCGVGWLDVLGQVVAVCLRLVCAVLLVGRRRC